jgi:hypothetical protein
MLEDRTVLSTVHALFLDPSTPANGVFPSDWFTVADDTQNTGRRVNLPTPTTEGPNYEDTQVINELDGFNLQPRLSIPFDGPINVGSVTSQDVFLVSLGDTLPGGDKGGEIVGINQVVWDVATTTLHIESDQLLDQHTRYALIVTNGVLDADGRPVQASEAFTRFRHDLNFGQTKAPALKEYRKDLLDATAAAAQTGVSVSDLVTASVFTTMSATAMLEKIRDQIYKTPAPVADFQFLHDQGNDTRMVYDLNQVTGITIQQQTTVSGPLAKSAPVILPLLAVSPGAVGQVAFGRYSSPDFEAPGEYIPAVGTRADAPGPVVQHYNEIYFDLYLPSITPDRQRPEGGWPVVIAGHGGGGNKDGQFGGALFAATMAEHGIATIAINAVGHGFGPNGTLTISQTGGAKTTLPAGGRGIDQNNDGKFEATDGYSAAAPREIVAERDGRLQTAADLMQLIRVIEAGVDVHGDGVPDLDPSHIYYVGASLSSVFGASFLAVEPSVRAGVLNTVGGGNDGQRLRYSRGQPPLDTLLAERVPQFPNAPGITSLDGLSVNPPYFNENMPLRDGTPLPVTLKEVDGDPYPSTIQSPVTNTVVGAMAIQEFFENWEWVAQPGNAAAYAPHLRKDPLPGVPAKPVIVQFAWGDRNVVNPATTAFLRAGDLADRATLYRYDLAYAESQDKGLPLPPPALLYPHTFGGLIFNKDNLIVQDVARGAQQQAAVFLASNGTDTIHPTPERFFEMLTRESPLPEGLNYTIVPQQLAPVGAAVTADGGSNDVSIPLNDGAWDGVGSIEVRATDLPRDLLALALGAMTTPEAGAVGRSSVAPSGGRALTAPAEQGEQSRGVRDAHGGAMDDALTAGTRPAPSPGSDLFDVAVLDQVFADSAVSPAAPSLDGPGL